MIHIHIAMQSLPQYLEDTEMKMLLCFITRLTALWQCWKLTARVSRVSMSEREKLTQTTNTSTSQHSQTTRVLVCTRSSLLQFKNITEWCQCVTKIPSKIANNSKSKVLHKLHYYWKTDRHTATFTCQLIAVIEHTFCLFIDNQDHWLLYQLIIQLMINNKLHLNVSEMQKPAQTPIPHPCLKNVLWIWSST